MEIVLFQMQQYQGASPERAQLLEILTHVLYGLDASDEALVFKCSEKIYQEMPALVIRCFIDEEGMIGHLNIYHVVQHLQRLTAGKPTVAERNQLVLQALLQGKGSYLPEPLLEMIKPEELPEECCVGAAARREA